MFLGGKPTEWASPILCMLKAVDNEILRVVDYWLKNIYIGYIIEFAVDTLN